MRIDCVTHEIFLGPIGGFRYELYDSYCITNTKPYIHILRISVPTHELLISKSTSLEPKLPMFEDQQVNCTAIYT